MTFSKTKVSLRNASLCSAEIYYIPKLAFELEIELRIIKEEDVKKDFITMSYNISKIEI